MVAFAFVLGLNQQSKPKTMMQAPASSQRVKPQHPKPQHLNLKLLMPIPGIGESGLRLPYGPRERSMLFCEYLRDVIYVDLRDNAGCGYASLMDAVRLCVGACSTTMRLKSLNCQAQAKAPALVRAA